jgi:hypothetical protein
MIEDSVLLRQLALRQPAGISEPSESQASLINSSDVDEFLLITAPSASAELDDVLRRAIKFALPLDNGDTEVSFLSLSAALESLLTFFRRQDKSKILAAGDFYKLETDLKKWLKEQPALAKESAKRALIYEKLPELNRFPFSSNFRRFCEHYSLDLEDLWPVTGKHAEWPLMEVRHRLVHGDPFVSRPDGAMTCAQMHLTWAVERMLLAVLGWPIERSNVSREALVRTRGEYHNWQSERAKFA